jgi:hypothetical protein
LETCRIFYSLEKCRIKLRPKYDARPLVKVGRDLSSFPGPQKKKKKFASHPLAFHQSLGIIQD